MTKKNRFQFFRYTGKTRALKRALVFLFVSVFITGINIGCSSEPKNSEINIVTTELSKEDYLNSRNKDSLREAFLDIPPSDVKNDLFFDLSYHFYRAKDSVEFKFWNSHTFYLSEKLKDTLRIAEAHWDLANFYTLQEKLDSAFYNYGKAAFYYKLKKDDLNYAGMLLNIAILQKNIRDYSGSESNTIQALKTLIPLEEHRKIYIGYNNLAILNNQLSEFSIAHHYHQKALKSAQEQNDSHLIANTLNNIGVVYEKMGEFEKAVRTYEEALHIDSLELKNVRLYAMLKDNLAYSKMKMGLDEDLLQLFFESLTLRELNGHDAGIVINKLHLGEFYLLQKDTTKAKNYFLQAYSLSQKVQLHRDVLQSLLFLSKLEPNKSKEYLESYIELNDSLEVAERSAKNRFMRIQLETDEYIAENEELYREKLWILGGSGGAVCFIILVFLFWKQKAKNKRLELEHEQQKSNEHIYNLMLDQERRVDEGRKQEKSRISRELHDGVLSTLYGVRFNLTPLLSKNDESSHKKKQDMMENLRSVEEEIRLISRDLQKTSEIEGTGFKKIMESFVEEQREIMGVQAIFSNDDKIKWEQIESKIKMNLFRILQEVVQNIRKYSMATEFSLYFSYINDKTIEVKLEDNGIGFDVNGKYGGIGLKNIRQRVAILEGKINIDSSSGGTKIVIHIPLRYV